MRESGNVERIVAEEGSLMKRGDTILTLTNPDLMRDLEDQRDEWEKQRISYEEKAIEMEQKTLTLKQQALEAEYELNKIRKSFALEEEEYKMGIRSKAQLEVSARGVCRRVSLQDGIHAAEAAKPEERFGDDGYP